MSRSTMRAPNARATATLAGAANTKSGTGKSATAGKAASKAGGSSAGGSSAGGSSSSTRATTAAREASGTASARSAKAAAVATRAAKAHLPVKAPAKAPAKADGKPAAKAAPAPAPKTSLKTGGKAAVPATLIAGRPVEATLVTATNGRPTLRPTLKPEAPAAGKKGKRSNEPLPFHLRPIDELWREYRGVPTKELRNFLIEKYLELVRFTAERMHMKLPSEVEVDDLMSAGLFGLMDAIDAFDPERGVKFETYCTQRIRGAIFDELRAMDWVPRLVRSRTAKVEKVRKQVEMETGRKATDAEIADRLKVEKSEFEKLQKDSRPVGVVSLNRKWFETDSSKDVREIDVIRDAKQESPVQQIQRQDLQTLITKGLSRSERLIVILYYYEEMTMKEIGTTLDLSESRVSQMHSSILARLKAQMQHREKDMEEA